MKRYLVERELIQNNILVLQKKAGSAVIWAVLKGNGYGLGLLPMAETCRAAGLDHFAVTEIAEARALREGGFETEPILMLQPTADADEITALLPLHTPEKKQGSGHFTVCCMKFFLASTSVLMFIPHNSISFGKT